MMSRRETTGLLAVAVLGGAAALASCGGGVRAGVYVRTPPPPAVVEVRGPAPGVGFVWIDGYQSWNGNAYVWVPGRWERPPRGRHHWRRGRWVHRRGGWVWVEGRWR